MSTAANPSQALPAALIDHMTLELGKVSAIVGVCLTIVGEDPVGSNPGIPGQVINAISFASQTYGAATDVALGRTLHPGAPATYTWEYRMCEVLAMLELFDQQASINNGFRFNTDMTVYFLSAIRDGTDALIEEIEGAGVLQGTGPAKSTKDTNGVAPGGTALDGAAALKELFAAARNISDDGLSDPISAETTASIANEAESAFAEACSAGSAQFRRGFFLAVAKLLALNVDNPEISGDWDPRHDADWFGDAFEIPKPVRARKAASKLTAVTA